MSSIKYRQSTSLDTEGISVIIPTYKQNDYLHEAIASVLMQDYLGDKEIVLIVNGKDKEYWEYLQTRYAQEPTVRIFNIEKQSAGAARNFGVVHANKGFILFLDDDDWLSENYLTELASHMNSNICIVCAKITDYRDSEYNTNTLVNKCLERGGGKSTTDYYAFHDLFSNMTGKLFRRSFYSENFAPFEEELNRSEDVVFWAENIGALDDSIYLCSFESDASYIRRITKNSLSRPGSSAETPELVDDRVAVITALWQIRTEKAKSKRHRDFVDNLIDYQWSLLMTLYFASSTKHIGNIVAAIEQLPASFLMSEGRSFAQHFMANDYVSRSAYRTIESYAVARDIWSRSQAASVRLIDDSSLEVDFTATNKGSYLQLFGGSLETGSSFVDTRASLDGVGYLALSFTLHSDVEGNIILGFNSFDKDRQLSSLRQRGMRIFAGHEQHISMTVRADEAAEAFNSLIKLDFQDNTRLVLKDVCLERFLGVQRVDAYRTIESYAVARDIWSRSQAASVRLIDGSSLEVDFTATDQKSYLQLFGGSFEIGPSFVDARASLEAVKYLTLSFALHSDVEGNIILGFNSFDKDRQLSSFKQRGVRVLAGHEQYISMTVRADEAAEAFNSLIKLDFQDNTRLVLKDVCLERFLGVQRVDVYRTIESYAVARDIWSRSQAASVRLIDDSSLEVDFTATDQKSYLQLFGGGFQTGPSFVDARASLKGAEYLTLSFALHSDVRGNIIFCLNNFCRDGHLSSSVWRVMKIFAGVEQRVSMTVRVDEVAEVFNSLIKLDFQDDTLLVLKDVRLDRFLNI